MSAGLDLTLRRQAITGRTSAAIGHLLGRISDEARWLWLAVGIFVTVSAWWLTQDTRIPDFDSGTHMAMAFQYHFDIAHGNLTQPFRDFNSYPPLVHLLGALTIFLVGMHPMALILSSNLVFVPLLAFGCYGVGRIVAGPRAGLLAGLFALGTPMFVSMMHEYDLDPPQAALVAVSVWAILASGRFERLGLSALAGVCCGLALMTKETSAVFLGGFLLVVIIRGGWRNWLGLIVFAFVLENVAGPWYVYHYSELLQTFTTLGQVAPNPVQAPARWSLANGGWYFWDLINQQILLPLAAAFVVGAAIAIRRSIRHRWASDNYLPELLIGGFASYLAMTYLTHKDPRYTLPALVYVAVLGTFWIPSVSRARLRVGLTAAIAAIAAINLLGMSTGVVGQTRVALALPGASSTIIYPWQLTLYENEGWVRGAPAHNGDILELLQGLHREGVNQIGIDPTANILDFSAAGIIPLAEALNMYIEPAPITAPDGAYLLLRPVKPGDPAPCQRLDGGLGIYVVRGSIAGLNSPLLRNPAIPTQRYSLVCPGRPTVIYPAA